MTIGIGVIGAGQIGEDHVRRLTQSLAGGQVRAVASRSLSSAERVAAIAGARAETDPAAVIAAPDVDAVLITSPSEKHEEQALAAIAAGKPVFCEKPLAVTAEGCRRIVQAEAQAGRRLVQVGFMRRYDSGYQLLKAALDGRALGQPLMLHCAHRNPAPHGRFTTDMSVTQTAIHEIDVTRWLLDDEFAAVQVMLPRQTANADSRVLRDPQLMLLTTRGNVCMTLEVYVNCRYGYDIQCEAVCETGVLRLPDPQGLTVRADAKRYTALETDWVLRFLDAYDKELSDWLESVRQGMARGPSAWDGYCAAVTADALIRAQQSGCIEPVELPARPEIYG